MFSGGALSRLSIFAMGVMPYISASIIIQMMSMVVPTLMELRKEGESGRRKITEYTRYGTVVLALFQSFAAAIALREGRPDVVHGWPFLFTATITMTTGTLFLMWLGEQITERGIGNGISMIILSGIVAGLPGRGGQHRRGGEHRGNAGPVCLLLLIIVLGVTYFVVFVERAQRRIPVNYAKRQVGRRMYAGQSSHLPFKINMSGVIPPIFASSLLLFPATIASFFGTGREGVATAVLQNVAASLGYGQPLHLVVYALLILFFCFFYTALVFNARDTAENLQEVRRLHPRHPSGPADRRLHRQGADAPDAVGRAVRDAVCLLPEIPGVLAGCAVPVRRHLAADRRGGGDGFHVAAAGAHDVASLSGSAQEGEPARLRPRAGGGLRAVVRRTS